MSDSHKADKLSNTTALPKPTLPSIISLQCPKVILIPIRHTRFCCRLRWLYALFRPSRLQRRFVARRLLRKQLGQLGHAGELPAN